MLELGTFTQAKGHLFCFAHKPDSQEELDKLDTLPEGATFITRLKVTIKRKTSLSHSEPKVSVRNLSISEPCLADMAEADIDFLPLPLSQPVREKMEGNVEVELPPLARKPPILSPKPSKLHIFNIDEIEGRKESSKAVTAQDRENWDAKATALAIMNSATKNEDKSTNCTNCRN